MTFLTKKQKYKSILILFFTLFIIMFPHKINKASSSPSSILTSKKSRKDSQEDEKFEKDVKKVCSRGSPNLRKYYETGDLKLINLSEQKKNSNSNRPAYINTLLDIINGEGDLKDNGLTYIKHAFSAMAFFIIGLAAVIGWIFCCFFCCCNCCCCCCFKKTECKTNFLIFTLIFDFAIVLLCIYGFLISNKIFIALGDVECSILKFISEIQQGESKKDIPKWIGFEKISNLFDDIVNKINEIKTGNETLLESKFSDLNQTKIDFPLKLIESYEKLLGNNTEKNIIYNINLTLPIIKEGTISTNHVAVLDLIYLYGPIDSGGTFINSTLKQFEVVTTKAEEYLKKAKEGFDSVLQSGVIDGQLSSTKDQIDIIQDSINSIKDTISDYIINYSETIDTFGKLIIYIFFIIIGSISIISAVFIILYYGCGSETCYGKCCCGRGCTKTFSHFSWNLMIFIMIITFFFAAVLSLLSYIGNDFVQVISIIISEENLEDSKPLLITGDAGDYLNTCFNKDGDLASHLNLKGNDTSTFQLDELNNLTTVINDVMTQTKSNDAVIFYYRNNITEKKNLSNVKLRDLNDSSEIKLDSLINNFNEMIQNEINDMWTLNDTCQNNEYVYVNFSDFNFTDMNISNTSNIDNTTNTSNTSNMSDISIISLRKNTTNKECLNFQDWKYNYSDRYGPPDVKTLDLVYKTVLQASTYYVETVNDIINYIYQISDVLKDRVDEVETAYNYTIGIELDVLEIYNETINNLVSVFDEYVGKGKDVFSFLNCQFIGTNVYIILKYLKEALGGKIGDIGVIFACCSFLMFFSACFTILEIIIINVSIYETKRRREKEEQFNLSTQRAVPYSCERATTPNSRKKMREKQYNRIEN